MSGVYNNKHYHKVCVCVCAPSLCMVVSNNVCQSCLEAGFDAGECIDLWAAEGYQARSVR